MFTRQQYMNYKCTHQEYYEQIGRLSNAKYLVKCYFGSIKKIRELYNENNDLNNVPLPIWDHMAESLYNTRFREAGDNITKSGAVCVLKAACLSLLNIHK